MNDQHKKLVDDLFERICNCLDYDDLDMKFVVHQTEGEWLDMTIFPVGDDKGHIVFDLKKLLCAFGSGAKGGFMAGWLQLAEDHKLWLVGHVDGMLVQVALLPRQSESSCDDAQQDLFPSAPK